MALDGESYNMQGGEEGTSTRTAQWLFSGVTRDLQLQAPLDARVQQICVSGSRSKHVPESVEASVRVLLFLHLHFCELKIAWVGLCIDMSVFWVVSFSVCMTELVWE